MVCIETMCSIVVARDGGKLGPESWVWRAATYSIESVVIYDQ